MWRLYTTQCYCVVALRVPIVLYPGPFQTRRVGRHFRRLWFNTSLMLLYVITRLRSGLYLPDATYTFLRTFYCGAAFVYVCRWSNNLLARVYLNIRSKLLRFDQQSHRYFSFSENKPNSSRRPKNSSTPSATLCCRQVSLDFKRHAFLLTGILQATSKYTKLSF